MGCGYVCFVNEEPSQSQGSFPRESVARLREKDLLIAAVNPRRRRPRTDWRLGGRTVSQWDHQVLVLACVVAGGAFLVSLLGLRGQSSAWMLLPSVVLWGGFLLAVLLAVGRSRPAGLFRFRLQDVVWGLALGLALRYAQGRLYAGDAGSFPASSLLSTSETPRWLLQEALPLGLLGPVVEELFFRAVILVTVYQLLRRSLGLLPAGLTASLVSAGSFVLVHAAFSPLGLGEAVQLIILGLICASLVLCTGRFWGAVLVHIVYNATYLVLVTIGSMLG